MAIRFDIITLFPELFDSFLSESLLSQAIRDGRIEVQRWNLRDWAPGRRRTVDDRPYGGGPGMVFMPGPVFDCCEAVQASAEPGLLILLTPAGERFTQQMAVDLASLPRLILLCGRYEGFDERIRIGLAPREISIGDYVLNGGEVPAMVLIEAIGRLIPGVVGDADSVKEDSFCRPGWVEYPQYTRPPVFRDMKVPDVLLGGNHQAIARWRSEQALARSIERDRRQKGTGDVDPLSDGEGGERRPQG